MEPRGSCASSVLTYLVLLTSHLACLKDVLIHANYICNVLSQGLRGIRHYRNLEERLMN